MDLSKLTYGGSEGEEGSESYPPPPQMTTIMRKGFIPQDTINPKNVHVANNAQLIGRRTDQERRKQWRMMGTEREEEAE